nr:MBL fold metallo-hydrolase [Ectobacillus ponti]
MEIPVPFPVETVNVFLVKGETLTLIDTGTNTDDAWNALVQQMGRIGHHPREIENVVITHHHADHCGLLDRLPRDIPVIGHPWNEPWVTQSPELLKSYQQFFAELGAQMGIPEAFMRKGPSLTRTLAYSCRRSLTHSVREGDHIDALPGFTVLETPGHASTHIALYREEDGLFIGGDVLLRHISSNPLLEPPCHGETERAKPLLQYNDTLRRLGDMPVLRVLAGHGPDVTEVRPLVQERLHKQEQRAQKVWHMLREHPMTAFEVCRELFPALYQKQLALTLSETVGQLDVLQYNQQVSIDTSGPHWVYHTR